MKSVLYPLIIGQFISFIVALGALFSKLLVDVGNVSCPALQSAIGYFFLFAVFTTLERREKCGFSSSSTTSSPIAARGTDDGVILSLEGGRGGEEGTSDGLIARDDEADGGMTVETGSVDDDSPSPSTSPPAPLISTTSTSPSPSHDIKPDASSSFLQKEDTRNGDSPLHIFFISIADSQADYTGNLAYSYGVSIASVGLLSSFTIPCAMVLSYFALRARYSRRHFAGVLASLIGLVFVVLSDVLAASNGGQEGRDSAAGDVLILAGSCFYAVSNVASEKLMKRRGGMSYFLARLGLFGFLISAVQSFLLERTAVRAVRWTESPATLYLFLYGFYFCSVYAAISLFLIRYDAVMLNLSMLTTDVWGIVFALFFFGEPFRALTGVGFIFVVGGLVVYYLAPAPTVATIFARVGEAVSEEEVEAAMLAKESAMTHRETIPGTMLVQVVKEEEEQDEDEEEPHPRRA